MPKKRTMVSESARKLADARKEFLLKHENKTPDRSQLKMYDLIYYNPVTNPMKKPKSPTVIRRNNTISEYVYFILIQLKHFFFDIFQNS